MLARVRSAAVLGIDAYLVDVETDILRPRCTGEPLSVRRAYTQTSANVNARCAKGRNHRRLLLGQIVWWT